MTDRERLLEQVRAAEMRSSRTWSFLIHEDELPSRVTDDPRAREAGIEAFHHALTALALRDVIEAMDRDGFSLADYQATPGL